MTKLLDRVTNQQVSLEDLSAHIVPGRYLLCEDVLINKHTTLKSGSVLTDDGSNCLRIGEQSFSCLGQIDKEFSETHKFVGLAIQQITESLSDDTGEKHPSPLLTGELICEEGSLNKLEELLDSILKKGHLQEISNRPRYDMRYDNMVQPISRSKRLASSSHRHLSAHSECWQSQTITGIQPKKVLSLVSEDEYNLYENRVFARLIEKLEKKLEKRFGEVAELENQLEEALKLEDPSKFDFRLSNKIFELWGKTFTTDQALLELEDTKLKLSELLNQVRGLTQGELYKRVPRNAQVPGRIRPTNILTHDQHYRHLLPLWNTLQIERNRDNLTPAEALEMQQKQQRFYCEYCRLVVVRALSQLHFSFESTSKGVSHFSRLDSREISLQWNEVMGLELTDSLTKSTLCLVPIYSWDTDCPSVIRRKEAITIPCCPNVGVTDALPSSWLTGENNQPLLMSPMDFYVEERVISLLNYWLISGPVQSYGQPVEKMPTETMKLISHWECIKACGSHSFRILSSPMPSELQALEESLKKNNARSSIAAVQERVTALQQLSHCPACNSKAQFEPRDRETFIAHCRTSSCEMIWTLRYTGFEKRYKQYVSDDLELSFTDSGRWLEDVVISDLQRV